jgi:hypothetical protein
MQDFHTPATTSRAQISLRVTWTPVVSCTWLCVAQLKDCQRYRICAELDALRAATRLVDPAIGRAESAPIRATRVNW